MQDALKHSLARLELGLQPAQLDTLCAFGAGLLEKNQVMNLTAITEPDAVATLHFLDCLSLRDAVDLSGASVIDVGCGAGFPGVPLKIVVPSIRLTLLDSLNKRIVWLRDEILPAVGLEAECICDRAEEAVRTRREQFDFAVSRAVARLDILAELCLPFVRVGGAFVAMKGAMTQQEVTLAQRAISILGGQVEQIYTYPVADAVHSAVIVRKHRPTPARYPRRYAKIKQQPL